MTDKHQVDKDVYQFIYDEIESVPHLEALLLLWNSRPQPWTVENLAIRLYIPVETVAKLLQDLVRRGLVAVESGTPAGYCYSAESFEQDQLIAALDGLYRREVVRISSMIHSKPSLSVREFARAFRFTKERE